MWNFIAKRVLYLIPLLVGVSLLTFLLMSLTPGDYFTELEQNPQISPETLADLRAKAHLDKAWYVRYGYWLAHAAQLDFGYSIANKRPASDLIFERLWNTFLLSFAATILAWGIAIPLGIAAAVRRDGFADRACSLLAFAGLSVPEVLLALFALMFAASTHWFPIGGSQSSDYYLMNGRQLFFDKLHHLILPTLVLGASELAGIMRQMRSNLLDTLRAEFVTTARAKGVSEGLVIYRHALRNAINPLLTLFGYSLASLLSGAFIVENVMAWPGLGRLTMESLSKKDHELVVASVVMATALLVVGNLIADLLLAWSDPRIRLK
ncbi:MAG: ABC transporter permease [Verrucomicrobia bacterium]|nr:ABC transporter permease [Verrucomicrobiota bacterium]MBI3868741.1 ABC transporter permease [Verrucomicrobiota bacterium]